MTDQTTYGRVVPRAQSSGPKAPGLGRLIAWSVLVILFFDIGFGTEFLTISAIGWAPKDFIGLFDRYDGPVELVRGRLTFIRETGFRFGTYGLTVGVLLWWLFGGWFERPARIPLYGLAAGAIGGIVAAAISTLLMVGLAELAPDLSGGTVLTVLWTFEGFVAGTLLGLAFHHQLTNTPVRSDLWYAVWPSAFALQQFVFALVLDQDDSANSDAIGVWTLFVVGPLLVAVLIGVTLWLNFRRTPLSVKVATDGLRSEREEDPTRTRRFEDV